MPNLIASFIIPYIRREFPPVALLGAPVNDNRYWDQAKQSKLGFLGSLVYTLLVRKINFWIKSSFRKKAKPTQMLMVGSNQWVTLKQSAFEAYLQQVKEKVEYDVIGFTAMDKKERQAFSEREALTWNLRSYPGFTHQGVNLFIAHFQAWCYCLKINEVVVVSEIGVEPLKGMPEIKIKDLAILTSQKRYISAYKLIDDVPSQEQIFNFRNILSPCCYMITPSGAAKLVKSAKRALLPSLWLYMMQMLQKIDVIYYPVVSRQMDNKVQQAIIKTIPSSLLQDKFWQNQE